jgi:hypothetical protein
VELVYRPDGQDVQRWIFDARKIRQGEMEAVERRTGWPFATEFLLNLQKGDSRARKALLWIMLRRQHPTLKYEDVDFANDEVVLEYDRAELAEQRRSIEQSSVISEEERALALEMIDAQMANAPAAPGKAPQPTDAAATGSPSPS